MGDTTGISWTDHTFNPWWGCTKIAPGCDNCYAATLDARTGGNYWDAHQKPRRTSTTNWRKVIKWHEQAEIENRRHRVFCGSMMDWCDKDAPEGARVELFEMIRATPMLDWQLLTKRATLIEKCLPADWGDGYDNVWLGVTVENAEYGYPRIDALRALPAKIRFISAEPLLGEMDDIYLDGIHWVIIGGESGPGYRAMEHNWADDLLVACEDQNVPVWFKQWGGNSRNKGGCEIHGREYKHWPRSATPLPHTGIDIRRAAVQLQWPERQLRAWLVQRRVIRKTNYGYETAPPYRGLLSTQTRQHTIITESGQRITRYYSVVLVTGDGLAWLRDARERNHARSTKP